MDFDKIEIFLLLIVLLLSSLRILCLVLDFLFKIFLYFYILY